MGTSLKPIPLFRPNIYRVVQNLGKYFFVGPYSQLHQFRHSGSDCEYMNYGDVNEKPGSRLSHVTVLAMTMFPHCILIMNVLSIQLVISGVIVTDDTVVLPGVIINNDSIILPGVEIDNVQA